MCGRSDESEPLLFTFCIKYSISAFIHFIYWCIKYIWKNGSVTQEKSLLVWGAQTCFGIKYTYSNLPWLLFAVWLWKLPLISVSERTLISNGIPSLSKKTGKISFSYMREIRSFSVIIPWITNSHTRHQSTHFSTSNIHLSEVFHGYPSKLALLYNSGLHLGIFPSIVPDLLHINMWYSFIIVFSLFCVSSRKSGTCPFNYFRLTGLE